MFSECLEQASEEEEVAQLDSGERIVLFDSKRGQWGEGRSGTVRRGAGRQVSWKTGI